MKATSSSATGSSQKTGQLQNSVEAYGVKGMKNPPYACEDWHKPFRSLDALWAWARKNDAEVLGVREAGAPRPRPFLRSSGGKAGWKLFAERFSAAERGL